MLIPLMAEVTILSLMGDWSTSTPIILPLLVVSAGGHDQPWVHPSKRITPKPLIDDTYNIEDENVSEQEYDIKLF